jgi:hypothetical protein
LIEGFLGLLNLLVEYYKICCYSPTCLYLIVIFSDTDLDSLTSILRYDQILIGHFSSPHLVSARWFVWSLYLKYESPRQCSLYSSVTVFSCKRVFVTKICHAGFTGAFDIYAPNTLKKICPTNAVIKFWVLAYIHN